MDGSVVSDMTCQELVELVSDFLDGTLDPETEHEVVEHVAYCDGCGAYIDQFRQTIRALGDVPTETLPENIREELLRANRDLPASDTTQPPEGETQ
ncbi:zf-HC2 domain-containing protein [Actinophytocola sp.]|uniref:anti-sigma factor family protein n=1 Tax=Actinophytocola sp. TaxID=1872138 RepID=UPI002D80E863|nr:zf-HC2 domain-containing protein [Actinophytocola sp.]HET9143336.1 zf-HC2 domain-containing protein [Actinophytocola sp.]